jgi:hypothetical protein
LKINHLATLPQRLPAWLNSGKIWFDCDGPTTIWHTRSAGKSRKNCQSPPKKYVSKWTKIMRRPRRHDHKPSPIFLTH